MLFYVWFFGITSVINSGALFSKVYFIKSIGYITLLEVTFQTFPKKNGTRAFIVAGLMGSALHFLSFIRYAGIEGGMRHGEVNIIAGNVIRSTQQNWYFLTYDNDSIFYLLPVVVAFLYYCYNYDRKLKKLYLLYLGFILFMFISKNAVTAMLTMLLYTGLTFYYEYFFTHTKHRRKPFKFDYMIAMIIGVVFSVFIVSIVGGGMASYVASFWGKNGSFSGRDVIWKNSIEYICKRPLFGYGLEDEIIKYIKLGQTHCHNILLQMQYTSGLIGISLFACVVVVFRPRKKNSFSSLIFATAIMCFMIASGADWLYSNPLPMALFYFAYYLNCDIDPITKGVV